MNNGKLKLTALTYIGAVATISGILALSLEIVILQAFRLFLWTKGIVDWYPSISSSTQRPTAASDIISLSWIRVSLVMAVIIAIIGIAFFFLGYTKSANEHS